MSLHFQNRYYRSRNLSSSFNTINMIIITAIFRTVILTLSASSPSSSVSNDALEPCSPHYETRMPVAEECNDRTSGFRSILAM